ncbi:MAG: phage head-tail adapter protein [Treponema sp.]|nr:MAG: phage head-tail adapter protein [Treponema sp.]
MGLNDVEILRRGTEKIINVNPCEIKINRHKESEDEYGNLTIEEERLEKQTVRIAELSHSETQRLVIEGVLKNHLVNVTGKFGVGGFSEDCIYKQSGRAEELNEEV